MSQNGKEQMKRLESLIKLGSKDAIKDTDFVTSDELSKWFTGVVEVVKTLKESNDSTVQDILSHLSKIDKLVNNETQLTKKEQESLKNDLVSLKGELSKKLEDIRKDIPKEKDDVDLSLIPQETPISIKRKLESLKGEHAFDINKAKGADKFMTKETLERAVGILDSRTSFLINKINEVQKSVGNSGNSLSATNGQYKIFVTVGSSDADYITDGTSDEVQIKQAINYVTGLGGGVVFVKAGTYSISLPILLKSNLWLMGAGIGNTIFAGASDLGNNAVMSGAGLIASPLTDLHLSDFTIDGTDMPRTSPSTFRKGIDLIYTLRLRIQNIRVYNTPATGIGPDCNVDMLIDNCITDTCGTLNQNPGYNGFGFGTGAYELETSVISNCIAKNCFNSGFLLEYVIGGLNSRGYEFVNCQSIGNKRGFRVSGASDVTFTNCKAYNSTFNGFYLQLFGTPSPEPQNTQMVNCEAYNNGDDGFLFLDQNYGQINIICEGCHSYGNTGHGLICGGTHAQIKNSFFWGNDGIGLYYHANSGKSVSNIQITGNNCYNNGQAGVTPGSDGIRVWGELSSIDNILIEGNHCWDEQAISTITDGAMDSVTNTTRLTSAAGGWKTTDIGQPITVVGAGVAGADLTTTISGYLSATVVILATAASTTVSGATVTYGTAPTQQFGIIVKDNITNAHIKNNTCNDNTYTGIFYQTSSSDTNNNVQVVGNIVYNNGKAGSATQNDGIRLWGQSGGISYFLVQGNRCYDTQAVKTQVYGLAFKDDVTIGEICNNNLIGNLTAPILNDVNSDATLYYHDNIGVDDVNTKTLNYTLTSLDKTILGDTTAGNKTMTLPTSVGRMGRIFTIKKIVSANTLTIDTTSSQTIDGSLTAPITVNNTSLTLQSDNANWRII